MDPLSVARGQAVLCFSERSLKVLPIRPPDCLASWPTSRTECTGPFAVPICLRDQAYALAGTVAASWGVRTEGPQQQRRRLEAIKPSWRQQWPGEQTMVHTPRLPGESAVADSTPVTDQVQRAVWAGLSVHTAERGTETRRVLLWSTVPGRARAAGLERHPSLGHTEKPAAVALWFISWLLFCFFFPIFRTSFLFSLISVFFCCVHVSCYFYLILLTFTFVLYLDI